MLSYRLLSVSVFYEFPMQRASHGGGGGACLLKLINDSRINAVKGKQINTAIFSSARDHQLNVQRLNAAKTRQSSL